MPPPSFLKDVNKSKDRWSINVAVFRRWDVFQKASPGLLSCTTMILVDSQVRYVCISVYL